MMAEGHDNKPAAAPEEQALKAAATPVELGAAELRGHSPLSPDELVKAGRDGAPPTTSPASRIRTRRERESIVRILEQRAATMPTPGDWVYVNNFRNPE